MWHAHHIAAADNARATCRLLAWLMAATGAARCLQSVQTWQWRYCLWTEQRKMAAAAPWLPAAAAGSTVAAYLQQLSLIAASASLRQVRLHQHAHCNRVAGCIALLQQLHSQRHLSIIAVLLEVLVQEALQA